METYWAVEEHIDRSNTQCSIIHIYLELASCPRRKESFLCQKAKRKRKEAYVNNKAKLKKNCFGWQYKKLDVQWIWHLGLDSLDVRAIRRIRSCHFRNRTLVFEFKSHLDERRALATARCCCQTESYWGRSLSPDDFSKFLNDRIESASNKAHCLTLFVIETNRLEKFCAVLSQNRLKQSRDKWE